MIQVGGVLDRVERAALRSRTLRGVGLRVRHLDLLAVTLEAMGWWCVPMYRLEVSVLPVRIPLLWVHGGGGAADAGLAVTVLAVRGGGWSYVDAGDLRERFLELCSDRAGAAVAVDARLKAQMYPGIDVGGPDGAAPG